MLKLFFLYSRDNRSSINALGGALEAFPVKDLKALFPCTITELSAGLRGVSRPGAHTAAAFSFFTCQARNIAALVKKLRKDSPGTVLIAGGPHPSACPAEALEMGFDYVVAGEGERAFPELLRALAGGRPPAPGIIRGHRADLRLSPPVSARHGLFGPIEITRGCPYACTFCQTSFLFGGKPRHRPVEQVLSSMSSMLARGQRDIRFITPDSFAYGSADGRRLNLPALEDLLQRAAALAEAGGGRIFFGSFPSEVRPDHVTPETLRLVKKYARNRRLVIGAQSASAGLLKAIHRGHGPEAIFDAVRLCREHKLFPYLDFIFGLPGETSEDEEASMEAIERLVSLGALIHTHAFMPLPGTPLAGTAKAAVSPRIASFLEKLESRGKAFGKWRVQRLSGQGRLD